MGKGVGGVIDWPDGPAFKNGLLSVPQKLFYLPSEVFALRVQVVDSVVGMTNVVVVGG
jgi:hypothetical protein